MPPFDIGSDTLIIAYSAWAEMTCFKVLDWKFPVHIFDLHTAYLAASNVLVPYEPDETRKKPRKRLSDACRAFGIEDWEHIDKETMAKDIGEGNWRKYRKASVIDYCEEDVRMSVKLLRRILLGNTQFPAADVVHVLHWSNYSTKTTALIQARGIPWDLSLWNLVQENKAAVIRELICQFDPSQGDDDPIYTPDGEWSYARFERWLLRNGITVWPRKDSGKLEIDSDAFRLMYHLPGIEGLHALRDCIGFIAKAQLPIGADGRNHPSLFPFCDFRPGGHDHVHIGAHQLGRIGVQPAGLLPRGAEFDDQIAAIDETTLAQFVPERRIAEPHNSLRPRRADGKAAEEPDAINAPGLLRARRKRPCHRGAEKRDELAPPT